MLTGCRTGKMADWFAICLLPGKLAGCNLDRWLVGAPEVFWNPSLLPLTEGNIETTPLGLQAGHSQDKVSGFA